MTKSSNYLKKLKPVLKELSEKYDLTEDEVDEILDHFFMTLKKYMGHSTMPTIKITNFGTFRPTVSRINWQIGIAFTMMRKGMRNRLHVENMIRRLWPIKQRLIQEKRGVYTYKEWKNKEIPQPPVGKSTWEVSTEQSSPQKPEDPS